MVDSGNPLKIETLLQEVVDKAGSDLHLQASMPAIIRTNGSLSPSDNTPSALSADEVTNLILTVLDEDQRKQLVANKEFDFSFSFGELGRFRVNAFYERGNLAAAFRLILSNVRSVDDLGLPKVVSTFADYKQGLVLFTGPTGSGKSTSLAAIVDKINTERAEHILTIEDPIEFTHKSKKSVIVQRELNYDTNSFAMALRSALRQDPDVVLVGEMRDLETIASAITIAETGHLVFATLHTNSAAQSIDRMIDVFPPHQQPQIRNQLANILVAICSQRLVPTVSGERVAAAEILVANSAVRNIIREAKTHQLNAVIQTGSSEGMQSMDATLAKLIGAGKVSYDDARSFAVDPDELDRIMRS